MQSRYLIATLLLLAACDKPEPPPVYQAVPVANRDIVVSVQAAGVIQPDTTVEVKSKASGEILDMLVETGAQVKRGDLMVRIDPRVPRNNMAQAQAQLDVARARLQNAESQKGRADELFKSQSITETEHEGAQLDYANARAAVIQAEVQVETARIELDDTDVRAPISGTVIEKSVERGQVISSPTRDVGGGTVLLRMADLELVQVRTLVDETDIGKIQKGLEASITVDAYPNQPFQGEVLKIEPLAETQQNVTMFPVLVRIQNRQGLLRPGMNTEVEIHVGNRQDVLAVPNAALRTRQDVASAAQVLGLDPEEVQKELATQSQPASLGARNAGDSAATDSTAAPKGNTMTMPNGTTVTLPEGVTEADVRKAFEKMRSGQQLSAAEQAVLQKMRSAFGNRAGGRRTQADGNSYQFGGSYIVFVLRNNRPTPVNVRTGLTDLDYSEVISGLAASDSVLVLPSASLVQSQQEFQERIQRVTGGASGGLRTNSGGNR